MLIFFKLLKQLNYKERLAIAGKSVGRKSLKRYKLLREYTLLRCTMIRDDIIQLLKIHPDFKERTIDDRDTDIQKSIDLMVDAMSFVQPPNIEKAEPLVL